MGPVLSFIVVGLLLAALLVWREATARRKATGLPPGRLVYADSGDWSEPPRPLFSARYGLTGRPDYLVRRDGRTIPVEVKPTRSAPQPFHADVLQLAAYCLLVEDTTGKAPPYGLIKYRDAVFAVDYTPELRRQLLNVVAEMRHQRSAADVARSHDDPARCRACGYRHVCEQRLEWP